MEDSHGFTWIHDRHHDVVDVSAGAWQVHLEILFIHNWGHHDLGEVNSTSSFEFGC